MTMFFEDFLRENAKTVNGGKNHRAPRSEKSGGNTCCRGQGLVHWELPTTRTIDNGKIRNGSNEDKHKHMRELVCWRLALTT